MTKLNSAFFYLAVASLVWGATAPIMKLTLTQVPPFSLSLIRMGTASLILLPFAAKNLKIERRDLNKFFWAAFLGTNLNLSFFFFGLKFTQAVNATILVSSVPIITLFAAKLFLKEKITKKLAISAIIAFVGITVIIGNPSLETKTLSLIGNVLLLISSLAWVGYEIVAKKLLKKYTVSSVTFYTTAIGAILFLPLALIEHLQNSTWVSGVTATGIYGILYGIIFASTIAYWFWQKGLASLPAGKASFFLYLNPISGIFFSVLLLGEKITLPFILGSLLIMGGVFLAEHTRASHPLHK